MPIDVSGVNQDAAQISSEAKGHPKDKKSLLRALSLAIGGFGAASQGQETPLDKIRRRASEDEELSIRRAGVRQDAYSAGTKALNDLYASGAAVTPEAIESVMGQFSSPEIERLTGGVKSSLEAYSAQLQTGRMTEFKALQPTMNANRAVIATMGLTPEEFANLYRTNETFRAKADQRRDATYLQSALHKVAMIKDLQVRGAIPETELDLDNIGDINAALTGDNQQYQMSDDEVETLRANEDAQRRAGIMTPTERALIEKEEIKDRFEEDTTGEWTKVTKNEGGKFQDYKKFKDGSIEKFGDPYDKGESGETTKSKWDMTVDAARAYIESQGYKVGQALTLSDRTKDPSLSKQMEMAMRQKFSEGGKVPQTAIDLLKSDPSEAAKQEFEEAFGVSADDYL